MTSRTRVRLVVAAVALAAAAVTVGGTVLASSGQETARPPAGRRAAAPPLLLDLGFRSDPEAKALRRGVSLYSAGERRRAAAIFARFDSLPAEVGAAVSAWPRGSLGRLEALARAHPGSGLVRLHLGLVRFWLRDDAGALAAWRAAQRVEPDSFAAIHAEDLLHPRYFRGRPTFVPSFAAPARIVGLPAAEQLPALERDARGGAIRARLLYGVALQRVGRPVSAARVFDAAAAAAPSDPEAQVAAAVGRFDKEDPSRAFSRLGPLAKRFPKAPTVRFHLGLLLLWIGDLAEARRELRLARAEAPRSPLGREANRFLVRLAGVRTG